MKKFLSLFLIAMFVFVLAACDGALTTLEPTDAPTTEEVTTVDTTTEEPTDAPTTEAPTTEAPTTEAPTTVEQTTADTTPPVLSGVDDIEIFMNTTFDALDGVSAIDNEDGDITDDIEVSGVVDTTKTGKYFLKYVIVDEAGNRSEATRYVTVVVDTSSLGDELVQNGDFSLGNAVWHLGQGEGSDGSFSVVDEVGVVTVTTPSWNPWAPRLESNVIEFENGQTYQITFDAKADAIRSINVQVGELLDGAPWFVDYKPGQVEIFDLTTDWVTYTFKFTMNQSAEAGALLEGQLLFENGSVEGNVGMDNLATVIYYDNVVIVEAEADPDTTAPTINGASDLTIETGSAFDPLSGVSAFDIVDGDIALDASNYTSDVDTATPGEYTVTYTVSDEAGNEATLTITITVVSLIFNDTSDITDGTFDTTTTIGAEVQGTEAEGYPDITDPNIWYYYLADWDGASATVSVVDQAAVLDVTAPGNSSWGVMLKQKALTLVTGETYKLTFTASASVDRDIDVEVLGNVQTFSLTSTGTSYSMMFTWEGENMTDAVVVFMVGNTAAYAAGAVTIDDVVFSQLEQDALVENSSFDQTGWTVWSQDWDGGQGIPNVTYGINAGVFEVTTDLFGDANWAIQLLQENLVLEAGKTYRVTFDAMADTVRYINVKMIDGNGAEFADTILLTDTMTTYTFEFTYDGTSTVGKLDFELGFIDPDTEDGIVPTVGTVSFDNIMVEEVDSDVIVAETNQVINGSFDELIAWGYYINEAAAATIETVDGQLVVTITNVGTAFWNIQILQENIELVEGATYTVVFYAMSDVARDMSFVLIDANSAEYRETFDLTTEMAVYTYTFVYDGTATSGKVDFELGNISASSVVSTVTFDSVSLFRNFNVVEEDPVVEEPGEETWVSYGYGLVENGAEKVVTYDAVATEWWNLNVQAENVFVDGTVTEVQFTFTGVAGQSYIIKYVQAGSSPEIFKQIEFVASGSQEVITLSISDLSEAQRASLDLFVIFAISVGDSGTFTLHSWTGVVGDPTPVEETWINYGYTINTENTTDLVEITYGPVGDPWWNENLQGSNIVFDGATYEAVEWTFTGTAGQLFLFKFETVGLSREVSVEATGSEQTVVLSLTDLTPEQRSSLNLFVIFAQSIGESGSLIIHSWQGLEDAGAQPLATPFGVVVNPDNIVWGAIPEATGFEIYIDGVAGSPFSVAANTYLFDLAALNLDPGTYSITLKALGDGVDYLDSALTGAFEYVISDGPTQLTTPFGVVVQPTQIVWGAIPEASGFLVYIDGVAGSPFSGPAGQYFYDLSALNLDPGTYNITLKAVGDGVNYSDSELTTVFVYTVQ